MKTRILHTLIALSVLPAAFGITVTTPGTLSMLIDDPSQMTALTVDGHINAADFDFIASITILRTLDLSGAEIDAYSGERLVTGVTDSPAATLPAYSLMGLPLNSLALPSTLRAIGNGALAGTTLAELTLPGSVTAIGDHAFSGSESLTAVRALGVASVGARAFTGCTALARLELPALVSVGDEALAGCTALASVTFPSTLRSIGARAFYGSGLTEADLDGCTQLTEVGDGAFFNCASLASVSLPESLHAIAPAIVAHTPSLTSIVMPQSATSIDRYAMLGATALTDWTVPASLETIGDGAMEGCTALTEIDARGLDRVPATGADVWAGVNQGNVVLYAAPGMAPQWSAADQWGNFMINASGLESVGTEGIADDPACRLRATVSGGVLTVSSSLPMTSVTVFDITGRTLAATTADAATSVAIGTDAIGHGVAIIRATHAGGRTSTIKTTI